LKLYSSVLATIASSSKYSATNREDLLLEIRNVPRQQARELADLGLDVWRYDSDKNFIKGRLDYTHSEVSDELLEKLGSLDFNVISDDLDSLSKSVFRTKRDTDFDYDQYHDLQTIQNWAVDMAAANQNVDYVTFGQSYEGRDMFALEISGEKNAPGIFIDCGIHAREWISPAWCQYLVHYLLDNPNSDPDVATLRKLNWYIVPVLNPDGYEFTWTTNRMWRKTRSENGFCIGVDPNRNYDANWGGPGSSGNSCTDTYRGPKVESEIETRNHVSYMTGLQSKGANLRLYLTYHSFSQLIIFPYAYDFTSVPENYDQLNTLAEAASEAIKAVDQKVYVTGQTTETLYPAAGGSDDWAKDHVPDLPLVYTVEMRDTGDYGFLLPEDQIRMNCLENFAAVKVMAKYVLEEYN